MRITIFILLVNLLSLNATESYSQKNRLSLSATNLTIVEALEQVRSLSNFKVLYSMDELDLSKTVDINCENALIEEVLQTILEGQEVGFLIKEDKIIISQKRFDSSTVQQEEDVILLKGKVSDVSGDPVPGVNVMIKGTTTGTITDMDGLYKLEVPVGTETIVFSFIGMKTQEIPFEDRARLNITMIDDAKGLDEVMVVAFGKQKKESVLASVTTIKPAELQVPSSNLTTALAGRMSGIISYQRSGEPGQDNAEFFIRGVTTFGYKKDPLILIDGIELSARDLSRLHPDDIEAFSIMKDATATALYGARGANGVILVTTKEGEEGKAKVNIRFENSISQPTQNLEFADPITYMQMHNEAVRTRDPLGELPYTQGKIDNTIAGMNPNYYPQTNWQDELLKKQTTNQRMNLNMSGGGKVARYYISGAVTNDNGVLKVDDSNGFSSNIDLKNYLIRSNININVTKTTEAIIRVHGTFEDYRGPIEGGSEMYRAIMRTNPVYFPAVYDPDEAHKTTQHILFGNYGDANYINPYAELVRGYKEFSKSLMLAQFELKQDLSFVTDGLNARFLGNTTRDAYFDVVRSYRPFYYEADNYNPRTDEYELFILNAEEGNTTLDYVEGEKFVSSTFYAEGALTYNKSINENHNISGLLVGTVRQYLSGNEGSLQASLPSRNLGLSGRFTYDYGSRYFAEFNFGYNGSERFSETERFGFFPSGGLAWYVSNEEFMQSFKPFLSKLKLKGTYGLVGNDQIGSPYDRFFYLSNVNLYNGDRGYTWGTNGDYSRSGVSISRYGNDQITWETAKKTNIGLELGLWNKIDIIADFFKEYRTNILDNRLAFSTLGLHAATQANIGEASRQVVDVSLDYNERFQNGLWITARGNFTYSTNQREKVEEADYSATPWLSRVGKPIDQRWGYIAERLFVDDMEVLNSPAQTFSGDIVRGGDIKYRDINGDDKITPLDMVPIGHPTVPEIIYGFGASSGYKGFDLSVFFQGSARSSFWIDANATAPFIDYNYGNTLDDDPFRNHIKNNALLQAYADSYWSEANRDIYALWPRLSNNSVPNNTTTNTWFMQNGAFLRLKSAEVGYSIPQKTVKSIGLRDARIYFSGTNLLTFSYFKLWDPEMGGNGLGYPVQRVYNIGVQVSF
jgi:TonB-linked SusC/RagA family outer membrane protein